MVNWRGAYFILFTTHYNNEIKKNKRSGTHNRIQVNDKLIPSSQIPWLQDITLETHTNGEQCYCGFKEKNSENVAWIRLTQETVK